MHRDVFVMFIACDFSLEFKRYVKRLGWRKTASFVLLFYYIDFALQCVLSRGQDTRLLRRDLNRMPHTDLRRAVRKR